ncbi:unnamed protein product, partial [Pylaiella littoralis]
RRFRVLFWLQRGQTMAMRRRRAPMWITFVLSFLSRKEECLGFVAGPADPTTTNSHHARQQQHQQQACSPLVRRRTTGVPASSSSSPSTPTPSPEERTAARIAMPFSRTALRATGFGPAPAPKRPPRPRPTATPTPDPSPYYPREDEEDTDNDSSHPSERGGDDGGDGKPFPELGDARKVEEPRGIGTLFESEDEVIRELSSEEYLELLKDWAPIASFASVEAIDAKVKEEATCILTVLRGMAEWQPKRNADYTKLGSKWSFGAPIGAIKGGQVDALACLQVSEDEGVVVEWICGNPVTLGIPGNAVEWLASGVHALCGKRLDLPVTISSRARGDGGGDG